MHKLMSWRTMNELVWITEFQGTQQQTPNNILNYNFVSFCSTTGALEAAHAQATGKMVLLSEQQLVDCAGDFNNFGCGGGLPSQAFEYIRYNGGLDTEESYPYTAEDGTCKFLDNKVGAQVYDIVNITEVNFH